MNSHPESTDLHPSVSIELPLTFPIPRVATPGFASGVTSFLERQFGDIGNTEIDAPEVGRTIIISPAVRPKSSALIEEYSIVTDSISNAYEGRDSLRRVLLLYTGGKLVFITV